MDSFVVRKWQHSIIDYILKHPGFDINVVILNDSSGRATGKNKFFIYRSFMRLDRTIFKTKGNLFSSQPIPEELKERAINVKPIRKKVTDEISDNDLASISSLNLDIIIRFGFRVLKGGILSAARLGVWSLHHGDNHVNRGGPPAFWEVVNREAVTGVTLLKLSEDLDGGTVLGKAFSKTDVTSFHRNQSAAYWSGIELFCSSLNWLSTNEQTSLAETKLKASLGFYAYPLYKNPTNWKALKIFARFWWRRLAELIGNFTSEQQWSIYYHHSVKGLEKSIFRYKKLEPPRGVDWADPFVTSYDGSYYLFFEEFIRKEKKAHISVLRINEKGQFESKTPLKVLVEDHHLSYPFVMEYKGKLYMTVESGSARKVVLYVCEQFPGKWEMKRNILEDIQFYDPTLYYHEGLWYLFGNIKPWEGSSADQYLAIYYTDDLLNGVWKPHAANPLKRDVRGARPAGKIFQYNGKLIRPSQIGAPKYGFGVMFYEILKLTPTDFMEVPVDEILPSWHPGLLATHTFNSAGQLSVVDAQKRRF